MRDAHGRVERHFVILCFAARWISGEPVLNEELDDARWLDPPELAGLQTTEGLAEIVAAALEQLGACRVDLLLRCRKASAYHAGQTMKRLRSPIADAHLLCLALPGARADGAAPRSTASWSGSPKSSARCIICARSAAPMKGRNGVTKCRR